MKNELSHLQNEFSSRKHNFLRPKQSGEQSSIQGQLTKSYILLFPLFMVSFLVVVIIGTVISHGWLQGSQIALQYSADTLIRTNIEEINVAGVAAADGGAAVVFEDGRVLELGGRGVFEQDNFSMAQWTNFLTKTSDPAGKWVYSIAYNEQERFWMVVAFPVSIRIRLSVATNTEAAEYTKALILYAASVLTLLLVLFGCALAYARYSANAFISPLRKLCKMVKRITRGEYRLENDSDLAGEFLWLKSDIYKLSERLSSEKTLREGLEHDKKQMLLDISHDLRNPLATIMGYAETLSTDSGINEEERVRYAEVIFRNSVRANSLMNDLFTYTKLDSAGFHPTMERGDICEFMREQSSLFLPQLEAAGIETDFDIPDTEILLLFDEGLLLRAFANLFTNCMEHNKAGTKFTLSLSAAEDFVQIVVADDGIGIEEAAAKNIFEPFVRSDKARNSMTGGSGLGLAITAKIIKVHDGSIELVTALDKGCRFMVRLKRK